MDPQVKGGGTEAGEGEVEVGVVGVTGEAAAEDAGMVGTVAAAPAASWSLLLVFFGVPPPFSPYNKTNITKSEL